VPTPASVVRRVLSAVRPDARPCSFVRADDHPGVRQARPRRTPGCRRRHLLSSPSGSCRRPSAHLLRSARGQVVGILCSTAKATEAGFFQVEVWRVVDALGICSDVRLYRSVRVSGAAHPAPVFSRLRPGKKTVTACAAPLGLTIPAPGPVSGAGGIGLRAAAARTTAGSSAGPHLAGRPAHPGPVVGGGRVRLTPGPAHHRRQVPWHSARPRPADAAERHRSG